MKILPCILLILLAFGIGWLGGRSSHCLPDSDTVTYTQTIRKVDVDTLYLLAPLPYLAWKDLTDTIHVSDSCWHFREYKEYRDSNYYAKISGVWPRLDEIQVYPHTVYQTEYITRYISQKPKKWGIGLSAGYGVGKHGLSPVLAVTVSYDLWQW